MPKIKIEGLKDLKKNLKKMSERTARNITVSALRSGATVMSKQAKSLVPQEEGDLKKSIGVLKRKTPKHIIMFSVTPRSKTIHKSQSAKGEKRYNYASHIEFGSRNQQAQPYMRPTFDSSGQNVTNAIVNQMAKRIAKEANKG